jgi:hypothetical protein
MRSLQVFIKVVKIAWYNSVARFCINRLAYFLKKVYYKSAIQNNVLQSCNTLKKKEKGSKPTNQVIKV